MLHVGLYSRIHVQEREFFLIEWLQLINSPPFRHESYSLRIQHLFPILWFSTHKASIYESNEPHFSFTFCGSFFSSLCSNAIMVNSVLTVVYLQYLLLCYIQPVLINEWFEFFLEFTYLLYKSTVSPVVSSSTNFKTDLVLCSVQLILSESLINRKNTHAAFEFTVSTLPLYHQSPSNNLL